MQLHQRDTQPRGVRIEHVLRTEVQNVLDQLAAALVRGDGEAVATLWETPAIVIGAAGVIAVSSREQVATFFGSAKDPYTARGITTTRAVIVDLERIDEKVVVATVRWPHLDAQGREVGAESSDYTLRRDDAGVLKVRSVLMRGVS